MSLQVCHCCGWSKVTTYQGLRTHQGKKGCTPKGLSIPQSDQYIFNSNLPAFTFIQSPIRVQEPFLDIFRPAIKSEGDWNISRSVWESPQIDSGPMYSTPVRTENVHVSQNFTPTPFAAATETAVLEMLKSVMENQQHSLQTVTNPDRTHRALDFSGGTQPFSLSPWLQTQAQPAAPEVKVQDTNTSWFQTPPRSHETATNTRRALDFSFGAHQVGPLVWDIPTTTAQQTAVQPQDKETETLQQVGPLVWDIPTTTAQQTAVQPQETETEREREKEKEKEMEKEREAQKLQKARHDMIRADLKQKVQMREQKMAEVTSSVIACKGSLDAEWLEINCVFSKVMRVVEETRQKALHPLEERRLIVKKEGQDLVEKLQKEIDKLQKAIDELDKNPDLQISSVRGLDVSCDWKNVTVDGSTSFSTLRTRTSNMMEQIHRELEKLSPVELKRIPTFAVDVKLDPTTAHRCLVLSPDGKKVTDGGKEQRVSEAPERFDVFGSILGINSLTSGKFYWEVEVSNKTGWDLGVARRDANRKGKLKLNPENGYWVAVHYEEDKYAALTMPPVSLSLTGKPQKVGVFVDYEEGLVSFYDVTAESHIYSFTECSFRDEIVPYFSPHLKGNEKNSSPLIISTVVKQQQ